MLAWQEQLQDALDAQEDFRPTRQLLATLEEDLDALDSIYQCGLTQERISNDVLSLGKSQLDRMGGRGNRLALISEMHDSPTNIRKMCEQLVNVFQYEARVKRLTLLLRMSDNFERLGLTHIMVDHVRLAQV